MAQGRILHRQNVAVLVMVKLVWLFAAAVAIAAGIVATAPPRACQPATIAPVHAGPFQIRICVHPPEYTDEFDAMLSTQMRAGLIHTPAGDALLDYLELRARLSRLCQSA